MYQAQSYYSTLLRGDFSVYEMRILMKIVQRTRLVTHAKGQKYTDIIKRPFSADGLNLNFSVPVVEIVGKKSHNTAPLKAAIRHISKDWHVEYYDKEKREWHETSVIYNVAIEERTGILRFSCAKWLVDYICDFQLGGYREYDFELAMSLSNPNAARMYLLTCSQNKPIPYSIDFLKKTLGVSGKYSRVSEFIRRVIKPAAEQLEKREMNGFTYKPVHRFKDKPKSEIIGLEIIPVKREKRSVNITKQVEDLNINVPTIITAYLVQSFQFTYIELIRNKATLQAFSVLADWQEKFFNICERTRRYRKNHGYIIQAMKNEIKAISG